MSERNKSSSPVEKRRIALGILIDNFSVNTKTTEYGSAILEAFDAYEKAFDAEKFDFGRFLHALDLLSESLSCMVQSELMFIPKDEVCDDS